MMNYALWIVQGLLALLFLFAGGMKLVMPIEALTEQTSLPGLVVRFIGVAEVLGHRFSSDREESTGDSGSSGNSNNNSNSNGGNGSNGARQGLALEDHLSDIKAVAKQISERTTHEGNTADGLARF